MSVSEKDASRMFCPFSRVSQTHGSFNRHPNGSIHSSATCIGAQCMGWLWDANSSPRAEKIAEGVRPAQVGEASDTPVRGSCGLVAAS